ncbi:zeatin O-glucosyltransferase-like [Nicotiana tabacum]|uniref:Glycosyltransferase n=2 Tax=Nicotiana TaxID=4085 RepID=A0A1S4A523_TOBAC|nr:PREDICTED: zeatin O-glucosyltransferase-like [Nicotiana sylvestris]XP_016471666.1 PREDICTED: zeatin O-glucosyltransferase-like [Nicotiana tabacum]WIW42859.1 UDP-glycosyltransferase [Nicotiana tabacum]
MASNLHFQNHGQKNHDIVVVVVPFPAQGHLNQLLQLCKLIASYNVKVHYVTTKTHTHQAKLRVHDPFSFVNIHFHEFSTPFFVSPPPNPNVSIKFPCHLQPSFEATSHLRKPVAKLLRVLSSKSQRAIIIHDSLMGSVVQDFVYLPNAEAYAFHSVSAFTLFLFIWENMGRPFNIDANMLKDVPSLEDCFSPEFEKFIRNEYDYLKFNSGKIYNTCKVIEGPFLDLLSKEQISNNKKQWALGPFNPVLVQHGTKGSTKRHKCLSWLDKQGQNSVIFVSFGTTTSFSDEQIKEMAIGLEKSEQKFVWVLRDADKGNVFAKDQSRKIDLPKGFEERVKEKGVVLRDWAPQLEILAHSSVGGFMSHCGWNSCMESISMGVPIAAWPMHSDQPRNTILVTKILKVGIVVKDWTRRHEMVTSIMVQAAVEKLMASKEGEEMRNRAMDLSAALKKSVAEGGIKNMELDSFISHITRQI